MCPKLLTPNFLFMQFTNQILIVITNSSPLITIFLDLFSFPSSYWSFGGETLSHSWLIWDSICSTLLGLLFVFCLSKCFKYFQLMKGPGMKAGQFSTWTLIWNSAAMINSVCSSPLACLNLKACEKHIICIEAYAALKPTYIYDAFQNVQVAYSRGSNPQYLQFTLSPSEMQAFELRALDWRMWCLWFPKIQLNFIFYWQQNLTTLAQTILNELWSREDSNVCWSCSYRLLLYMFLNLNTAQRFLRIHWIFWKHVL